MFNANVIAAAIEARRVLSRDMDLMARGNPGVAARYEGVRAVEQSAHVRNQSEPAADASGGAA